MAWSSSHRRKRLPPNWSELRTECLRRDPICRWMEHGEYVCKNPSTEADHIEAKADDHSRLQGLCSWHHQQKSSMEGAEALAKKRERIAQRFVRTEAHPGSW